MITTSVIVLLHDSTEKCTRKEVNFYKFCRGKFCVFSNAVLSSKTQCSKVIMTFKTMIRFKTTIFQMRKQIQAWKKSIIYTRITHFGIKEVNEVLNFTQEINEALT